MANILVTGAAGFIGFHACSRLLREGNKVLGIDAMTSYYDIELKRARLERLVDRTGFQFEQLDISDSRSLMKAARRFHPSAVVNLAAQVGVRHSLKDPGAYVSSNLVGFVNVLECCRELRVEHLVFASSSSVYGASGYAPYSEHASVDHPVSLYAATKKSDELMAHAYAHLFSIPCTGLRFFTVYGPWGRPDMAPMLFTRKILAGEPIEVFNQGRMWRDFTYVDDIVEGLVRVLGRPAKPNPGWTPEAPDPASSSAPYRVYNIGHGEPVDLMRFIDVLESCLGTKAQKVLRPIQPGDVIATHADVGDLERDTGYRPCTPLEVGIGRMVDWYRAYYGPGDSSA